jgi:hypothetical protein
MAWEFTMPVTAEYVRSLPPVYRDILAAFPQFDSTRKSGYGLSFQSLYSALDGEYTLGQIQAACEQMAQAGVMEIRNKIFATPTPFGEELIAAITGADLAPNATVPPFPAPH